MVKVFFKLIVLMWLVGFSQAVLAKRVALVIGNHDYTSLSTLSNPGRDASAVAIELRDLGFELIGRTADEDGQALYNLSQAALYDAVHRFSEESRGAEIAFVYYAGHGFQYKGQPYVIPIDAPTPRNIKSIRLLQNRSIGLDDILSEIDNYADLTVGVFDACREVPEIVSLTRSISGGDTAYRGLGVVRSQGKNRIIAYAGASGQLVQDGAGNLSPYTQVLVNKLKTVPSHFDITDVFQAVAYEFSLVNDGQHPELSIQGVKPNQYFFRDKPILNPNETEIARWQAIKHCQNKSEVKQFLNDYPNGLFSSVAKLCLEKPPLHNSESQPGKLSTKALADLVKQAGDLYLAKNYKAASDKYLKAAEQGYAIAQYNLGFMYDNGRGLTQSSSEAVKWFRKAAEQGHALAQLNLGYAYFLGDGVTESDSEVVKWFRKAAEQGVVDAQLFLGEMYANGYAVTQSYSEAAKWYRKAAEQGDEEAQFYLGKMYANGDGVTQSYSEAAKWYRKLAEQGYATAQYNIGFMYDNGRGLPQSSSEAVKWYRKAAEQGHTSAQFNLGYMYANGDGVPQSYSEAAKWYRKAAEQGEPGAQFSLGVSYENGYGVTRSNSEAVKWYQKAAKQGKQDAIKALERLNEN
jgi:TPR repeat protein